MNRINNLHETDVRLDNLSEAIESLIEDRVSGTDITMVAVVGLLMRMIYRFNTYMDD